MTQQGFSPAWEIFAGTFALHQMRRAAYWDQLRDCDPVCWMVVAQYYAGAALPDDHAPSPGQVRQAVEFEAQRRGAATGTHPEPPAACDFCDHGQVMLWRIDYEGHGSVYHPLNVMLFEVGNGIPPGVRRATVNMTTASCVCAAGDRHRAACANARDDRGKSSPSPALRRYDDLVGSAPRCAHGTAITLQDTIRRWIADAISSAPMDAAPF